MGQRLRGRCPVAADQAQFSIRRLPLAVVGKKESVHEQSKEGLSGVPPPCDVRRTEI